MPAAARLTHPQSHAGNPASVKPKLYNPRHPSPPYCSKPLPNILKPGKNSPVAGQFYVQDYNHTPKLYLRQAFRRYPKCGIFAHGFAKA